MDQDLVLHVTPFQVSMVMEMKTDVSLAVSSFNKKGSHELVPRDGKVDGHEKLKLFLAK